MSGNTGRCEEFRAALAEVVVLEELADRHVAHADHCDDCALALERQRSLALLVTRARRAHDRSPDLSLQSWAHVRQAVDLARSRRKHGVLVGFGFVALAALALLLVLRGDDQVQPIAAPGLAPGIAAADSVTRAPPALEPRGDTLEGSSPITIATGDVLEGGADGRTLEAFGRHTVIIESGAALTVARWEPGGMELAIERGSATFEVERASAAETFIVRAADITVTVKGTIFSVDRGADGETRVTVDRGRVLVSRDDEEVFVEAGERVTFPAEVAAVEAAPVAPEASDARAPTPVVAGSGEAVAKPRPARKTPAPEKVVAIDVGMQRAPGAEPAEPLDVTRLLPAVLQTVRAGRCAQALNALGEIRRALAAAQEDGPRPFLWLTAYCKRKLGDVDGSAGLFKRYGTAGPWPVPVGAELPPLP